MPILSHEQETNPWLSAEARFGYAAEKPGLDEVSPEGLDQFRHVLEASGSFTSFVSEYVRSHKITEGRELPVKALDPFQAWLSERRIQLPLGEWPNTGKAHMRFTT